MTLALGTRKVPKPLPRHHDHEGVYYRAFEVEAFLQSLRVSPPWTVDRRDGTFQMLSETLLIAFRNSFHPGRAVFPLLVQPIFISQIADFLSGGGGTASAFERFGIREPDGSFCKMTSHQFRHWLNYIADKGGLPVELQSRWMGREHSRDTDAYRHATVDERLEWVKRGFKTASWQVRRPACISSCRAPNGTGISMAKFKRFTSPHSVCACMILRSRRAHTISTAFADAPTICVSKAVRAKDATSSRSSNPPNGRLTSAKARAGGPDGGVAEPWIRHCEETLEGVRAALAVDDETESAQAGVAQPFRGRRSRFERAAG